MLPTPYDERHGSLNNDSFEFSELLTRVNHQEQRKQYEIQLRMLASFIGGFLFSSLETGLSANGGQINEISRHSIDVGITALFCAGISYLMWSSRAALDAVAKAARFTIFGSTLSATIAAYGVFSLLVSIVNRHNSDAMIEGTIASLGFVGMVVAALIQHYNPNARAQSTLWELITCKNIPEYSALGAGLNLGAATGLGTLAYFSRQRGDYGSTSSQSLRALISTGLFVATVLNQTGEETGLHGSAFLRCVQWALFSAGIMLLYEGTTNRIAQRSDSPSTFEMIFGGALLLAAALCKLLPMIYNKWRMQENTAAQPQTRWPSLIP